MPQSFTSLLYHVIFSTKHREPLIDAELKPRLHAYLGGIVNDAEGRAVIVGGVEDHVHVLAYLPKTMTVPDALRTMKSKSSGWVHRTFPDRQAFAWQQGYAAFTVSLSVIEDVRRYIENQVEHHRTVSFQDEYRMFLRRHGLEWDEQYVWD
ncbi:MAG TPA: IS200/IS605 family transposase [Humisphaera sp.]